MNPRYPPARIHGDPVSVRATAEELVSDDALFMDGHDAAIIGVANDLKQGVIRVVYDERLIIKGLEDMGMSNEDAWDWYGFNIADAYVGEGTPVIVHFIENDDA